MELCNPELMDRLCVELIPVYTETQKLTRDKQGEGDRGEKFSSWCALNKLGAMGAVKKESNEVEDERN